MGKLRGAIYLSQAEQLRIGNQSRRLPRKNNESKTMQRLAYMLACVLLAACSDKASLSREHAKDVISKAKHYPLQQVFDLPLLTAAVPSAPNYGKAERQAMQRLQDKKMATVNGQQMKDMGGREYMAISAALTPEAQKFVVGPARTPAGLPFPPRKVIPVNGGEVRFGEITGIAVDPSKTRAVVEYTEEFSPNVMCDFVEDCQTKDRISKETASLRLYDDGWRDAMGDR